MSEADEDGRTGTDNPVPPVVPASEPVLNIPPLLFGALALMAAIHAVDTFLLGPEMRLAILDMFSFQPLRYQYPSEGQGVGYWLGPVSYSLLHGSLAHIVFNSLWLAVFGTPLARRISAPSFILFWILSAAFSAFAFAAATGFAESYLIGASGVVSATSGAVCRFAIGGSAFRPASRAHLAPRLSITEALSRRMVLAFAAFSIISNLVIGLGLGGPSGDDSIAWQAHIGGFLFGFLGFAAFDRR